MNAKKLTSWCATCIHKLYVICAIAIVIAAVLMSTARLLSPVFSHYKPELEQWTGKILNKPVTIETAVAKWRNFHPVLDLKNVVVRNKSGGKKLYQINDIEVGINWLSSLLQRKVIIKRLYVSGAMATIQQAKDGKWLVKGVELSSKKPSTNQSFSQVVDWVLSQNELIFTDINLTIIPKTGQHFMLHHLNLALQNSGEQHRLRGKTFLGENRTIPVQIGADLQGVGTDLPKIKGRLYLRGDQLTLHRWLKTHSVYGYQAVSGKVSVQLWLNWANMQVTNAQSKLLIHNFVFRPVDSAKRIYKINDFQSNLAWKRTASGWQLSGDHIHLMLNDYPWKTTTFAFWSRHHDAARETIIEADYLRLNGLGQILQHLTILPSAVRARLHRMAPKGILHNFSVHYSQQKSKLARFFAQASFENLAMNAYGAIPGFKGLSGKLIADQDTGVVHINSQHATTNLPKIFANAFTLNSLQGIVQWQKHPTGMVLQGIGLQAKNANLNVQTNFSLELPDHHQKAVLHLLGYVEAKGLEHVKQYLPLHLFPKPLAEWLSQAFVAGDSANVKVILNGPLDDYPFKCNTGQYLVNADVHNLSFYFAKDWQPITGVDGSLTLHNDSLIFHAKRAKVAGQLVTQLSANIPSLSEKPQAKLRVRSKVVLNSLAVTKQYIEQSPLKTTLGKTLAPLEFSGKGQLNLNLLVPIKTADVSVKGGLQFAKAELALPKNDLTFTHLNGLLNFTNETLTANNIKATLFGHPVTASIKTMFKNKQRKTLVGILGKLDVTDVEQYFSLPKLTLASGQTPFSAELTLTDNIQHLMVKSPLAGVAISLPKPFYKAKYSEKPIVVNAYFSDKIAPVVRIHYLPLGSAELAYHHVKGRSQFYNAAVNIGQQALSLPERSGVFVYGKLASFNWEQWKPILSPYLLSKASSKNTQSTLLKQLHFRVQDVTGFSQHLQQVDWQMDRLEDSWQLTIASDNISGLVNLPDSRKQPILAEFTRLYVVKPKQLLSAKQSDFSLKNLPPLSITARDTVFDKRDFGQVQLVTKPSKIGVEFSNFQVNNDLYHLNASGFWRVNDGKNLSSFNGDFTTNDLGQFLASENITKHVRKGKGAFSFSLKWADKPTRFKTNLLNGQVHVAISNGAVEGLDEKTQQKIGLAKLINVFSLSSLTKYFTLNFSSNSGFTFNLVKGDIDLANGKLSTQNLYLDSTIAEMFLRGDIDINAKKYNLNLRLSPYYTSSLPLIATVAGGPVAGVATWLVSKIAHKGLEKVSSFNYKIRGPWSDPKIQQVGSVKNNS